MIASNRRLLAIFFLPLSAGVATSGCGGGSARVPLGATPVSVAVAWPARTFALAAPGSAEQVRITLKGDAVDGSDLVFTSRRPGGADAVVVQYTSTQPARIGSCSLLAEFLPSAHFPHEVTAVASAQVAVTPAGALANPDGSRLGTISTVGQIASVAVVPNQTIIAGQQATLQVAVTSKSGGLLAVSPSDVAFHSDLPQVLSFSAGSSAHAGMIGTAEVTAVVDSITSLPVPVSVITAGFTQFAPAGICLTYDATRDVLYLANSATYSVDVIDPANGSKKASIVVGDLGGNRNSLALSDDDAYLYVTLTNAAKIVRINLSTMAQDFEFSPDTTGQYLPAYAHVQPGHPNTVAVTVTSPSGQPKIIVYDSGIPRVTAFQPASAFLPEFVFDSDGSCLYAYDGENLCRVDLTASGLHQSEIILILTFGSNGFDMKFGHGQLVAFGRLYGVKPFALKGSFAEGKLDLSYPAFDPVLMRVYYLQYYGAYGMLDSFSLLTTALSGSTTLSGTANEEPLGPSELVDAGKGRVAFLLGGSSGGNSFPFPVVCIATVPPLGSSGLGRGDVGL